MNTASEWQPIETAPRGVPVLVARPGAVMAIAILEADWAGRMAWYESVGSCVISPTHWRLLPDPPAAPSQKAAP